MKTGPYSIFKAGHLIVEGLCLLSFENSMKIKMKRASNDLA